MEKSVNHRIKELRGSLNSMSQSEFARYLGVSQLTVSRWEGGSPISKKSLHRISDVFGVSVSWLEDGVGEMEVSIKELEDSANPWRDALVQQLNDEVMFLRNALNLALGGKEANFLKAFDLAVPDVVGRFIGIQPQMEVKSVSKAA